ncbi:N-acetylglucosamine-6-phosphate deacetylase [Mesorhizobium microcysteis]|uniref:N-acetylglucosamine-6-phosphate deacetylase n=2 Tax=Neoaquamicrobium microcysteis TaxID=2682781 RepID=A0A5D4GS56_9HYPH|nr:N-acetylglucosamine-6-phosphate deacetylase [Mesorhizobium microcysteis]
MSRTAITGARIFDGERCHDDSHLIVEDGRIIALARGAAPAGLSVTDLAGGILSPGFIDVQVNGGGGVLLNENPTAEGMGAIAAAHRRYGTTALLPTLITDTRERTAATIEAAIAAQVPGVIGLHLEGPHLDPARKGAHLAELMRPLKDDDIALYASAAEKLGSLMVTLAPRNATPEAVARLAKAGVIVSLGHAECTADEAEALFDAGARGATHLYNAMSPLTHREPGLVGAVLTRGDVWTGIIADGHHVDPRALEVAFAAKAGPARIFLVTDAMSLVGSDEDEFQLNGRTVRRHRGDFCPRLTLEDGTLAGSDIDMASSLRFLVAKTGMSVEDTLRRATADPADFLRIGDVRGRLVPGARADLVHLDDDLNVKSVWLAEEL